MKEITFSKEIIQSIKELYESGIGATSIPGKLKLDTSWGTINRLIKKNGWITNYIGKKYNRLTVVTQYKEANCNRGFRTRVECKCECGNTKHVLLSNVKNGHVKSCGCLLKENNTFKRKEYGESSFNLLYNAYVNNARHARNGNREFSLSKDDAKKLFKGKCFYCGIEPATIKKLKNGYGEFVYNGIDRKDNTRGYTIDNCVSCCEFCNLTKNDTPFNLFIEWVRKVDQCTKEIML